VLAVGIAIFFPYTDAGRKEGERKTEAKLRFFPLLSFTLPGFPGIRFCLKDGGAT